MSPANRSRRNNNRPGNTNNPAKSGSGNRGSTANRGNAKSGNRNSGRSNKPARPGSHTKYASRDFWGDRLPPAEDTVPIPMSHDATAVIRSLGDPPLRGHEHLAGHYFAAVYGRASSVASALAAASGLLDMS